MADLTAIEEAAPAECSVEAWASQHKLSPAFLRFLLATTSTQPGDRLTEQAFGKLLASTLAARI